MCATTWINLENITLSGRNQAQMIPFIGNVQNGQIHDHLKRLGGGMGVVALGYGFFLKG